MSQRKLYDLAGAEADRRFSPYCWRIKLALAHKGLDVDTVPWRFSDKDIIKPFGSERVPVLIDGDKTIVDSWVIANYLEDTYPDTPSLFGGEGGRAAARFINSWSDVAQGAAIFRIVVADIFTHVAAQDRAYFRESREKRIGMTLEQSVEEREMRVAALSPVLDPLRTTLRNQPFLGGNTPLYTDYIVFGIFQWARCISPVKLIAADDPIYAWRERIFDLFGGMPRKAIGYDV